ncbi:O(6)-methylguanine-induced apoptosis 2 [Thalassophryne amazonica]|uniref:O(6)-methylguanine-induced apoptosis 2 n=1 Tax=Thalassophryne amazonica TaxID=390379 RepID=UPI001471C4A2|nr:O(6)-methylguanine-induced apoptosis 2 [Thalassophryne amazonica]
MKSQRLVANNQEKKGFSSQAKRFPSPICLNENPGPGSYDCISSTEVISPSFSKKGTTGFVGSKAAGIPRHPQRNIPPPNAYNLQGSFINKYDFNTGVSRVFRLPVAVQLEEPKHQSPAPNQYHVCSSFSKSKCSMSGTSSFLSKSARNSFCANTNVPSPCHYKVKDSSIFLGPKTILSPFKSKTVRVPPPKDYCVPGPGAYSPHQAPTPVKSKLRRYYLATSAPPVIVPKDPPLPGPGHYDITNNNSPLKHHMSSAAFASTTDRILHDSRAALGPGPGFYEPRLLSKQSFLYSESRIWIPV